MLMDEAAVRRALARITHEIVERNCGADDLVLLGIRRRGVPLARMLSDNIARFEGVEVPVAELDVTLHRDDIDPARKAAMHPAPLSLPFDISGKTVIMVDDVLFTGRTARAAMDAIFFPRPAALAAVRGADRPGPPGTPDPRGLRGQKRSHFARRVGRGEDRGDRRRDRSVP